LGLDRDENSYLGLHNVSVTSPISGAATFCFKQRNLFYGFICRNIKKFFSDQ
jgi:hypothetical protein